VVSRTLSYVKRAKYKTPSPAARLSPPLASESRRLHFDARTAKTPIRASGRHAIPRVRARGDGAIRGAPHCHLFVLTNYLEASIASIARPLRSSPQPRARAGSSVAVLCTSSYRWTAGSARR
jgi:hypothetical protein